ncbi:MAG TPA: molecular chaperone DnaJ [Clostridiales bacterium UBA8153]|nr:molecular chaperone DnaJ [Clostridiales bacterium UBA8153]
MSGIPDNIIIIHPDFEKLKTEVEKLRAELSVIVLERDDLLYQECKNIEMAYMLSVGALEYKAYEIECAVLRLKRKAELIQAKKNRQEKVILSQIEAILDAEFTEYKAKLDEQINKMNEALERSRGEILSEAESRELKKLYRAIVKALHPDVRPDLSSEKLRLFHNAVVAYEHGDLEGLRIISAMVAEPTVPDEKSEGLAFLIKERERLAGLLQSVKSRIVQIKSEYPYTMKSIVQSPEKIEARKSELGEQIKSLNEIMSAYSQRLEEMLR